MHTSPTSTSCARVFWEVAWIIIMHTTPHTWLAPQIISVPLAHVFGCMLQGLSLTTWAWGTTLGAYAATVTFTGFLQACLLGTLHQKAGIACFRMTVSFKDLLKVSHVHNYAALGFTAVYSHPSNSKLTNLCVVISHLSEDPYMELEGSVTHIPCIAIEEASVHWHKAAIAWDFIWKKVCSTHT